LLSEVTLFIQILLYIFRKKKEHDEAGANYKFLEMKLGSTRITMKQKAGLMEL